MSKTIPSGFIESAPPSMNVIDQRAGFALVEITPLPHLEPERRFYVVRVDDKKGGCCVQTAIPADAPDQKLTPGGSYVSAFTPRGVMYVANPRTRTVARRWFTRLVREQEEVMDSLVYDAATDYLRNG